MRLQREQHGAVLSSENGPMLRLPSSRFPMRVSPLPSRGAAAPHMLHGCTPLFKTHMIRCDCRADLAHTCYCGGVGHVESDVFVVRDCRVHVHARTHVHVHMRGASAHADAPRLYEARRMRNGQLLYVRGPSARLFSRSGLRHWLHNGISSLALRPADLSRHASPIARSRSAGTRSGRSVRRR